MTAESPISIEQPEAPVSFTLTFWVHGFRATATLRDPSFKDQFHEGIKITADTAKVMSEDPRFEPSWEQSKLQDNNLAIEKESQPEPATKQCEVHNKPMKRRTGNSGQAFYSHARKLPDGSWDYCSGGGWKSDG